MRMIERVWREKRQFLWAVAKNVSADPGAAEDILQEAFTKALESRHNFEDPMGACRFLCRVITNIAIDNRRLRRRRLRLGKSGYPAMAEIWLSNRSRRETFWSDLDPLRPLVGEEREVLVARLMHEIRTVMQALPHKQKEAIDLMFFRERITLKDACREKGIPYSTLRSRMKRGVDRIRARLRRKGYLSPSTARTTDRREARCVQGPSHPSGL